MPLLLVQWPHWLDVVPVDFLIVLQCAVQWVQLSFPDEHALCYCTGVSLSLGRIYFLCNGHGGVVSLVLWVFCVFCSCWSWWWSFLGGSGRCLISFLSLFHGSTLRSADVWYIIFGILALLFLRVTGRVDSASLFGSWIITSIVLANPIIAVFFCC